jgi:beta-glucanase (GH16 family)
MNRFLLLFISSIISIQLSAQDTWVEVWSDEFDYTGLPDPNKWGYDVGGSGWGNQESQYYTEDRLENASVENGMLTITAQKESFEGSDYTSARLVTKGKGDWLYGKMEVRAKIPTGIGMWPAIWMLPTDNAYGYWPSSGEIDIMENVGFEPDIIHWNIHTESYNHTQGTNKGDKATFTEPYNQFYTYSVEWHADRIDYFVDDVKYFTFNNENNSYKEWPFDQRFHLILNIAVGGTWGGLQGINDSNLPQTMEVDYVRVYQLSNGSSENFNLTLNESTGGSISSSSSPGQVARDTEVTLEAVPDEGFLFKGWNGTYGGLTNPVTFPMQIDVEMTPVFEREGEMVINGTFSSGGLEWWTNDGGSSSADLLNGTANFDIYAQSSQVWEKQLVQDEVSLIDGHEYQFSFDAWGDESTTIDALIGLNGDPWTTYIHKTVALNSVSTNYLYTFNMNTDDPAARLAFDLGSTTGNIHIDNVSLVDLSLLTSTVAESGISHPSFPNPVRDVVNLGRNVGHLIVYDITGNIVAEHFNCKTLNLGDLNTGVYFLEKDGVRERVLKK